VGHVARMRKKRTGYRLLVGKPEGKRPQGRPRSRWVGNIKMDLVDIGLCEGGVNWSGSETVEVEGSCERGNEPSGSIKCWESTELLHNWRPLE
jgi:hypothetical protein